jgi:ATP-binding cassette, subfamily A (ABC1), member 3
VNLQERKPIGIVRSALVLFVKRLIILRRNFWGYILGLIIPPFSTLAAAIFPYRCGGGACGSNQTLNEPPTFTPASLGALDFVIVPASSVSSQVLKQLTSILGTMDPSSIQKSLHMVNILDEFNQYIDTNYANVRPDGIFLGSNVRLRHLPTELMDPYICPHLLRTFSTLS